MALPMESPISFANVDAEAAIERAWSLAIRYSERPQLR